MSNYKQISNASQGAHFSRALFGSAERSTMVVEPELITAFNAGDIVPVYCREVLPEEELSIDLDFVIRQSTLLTPTMGSMHADFFAFWVPNRVVNASWKAVEGENYSGSWTANPVTLAPLVNTSTGTRQIPVGSVADYYDFPTQQPIPNSVLSLCHDLKFRGYVKIYNEFFRDQNYQPPIPFSNLNVYQGFLDPADSSVPLDGNSNQNSSVSITSSTVPDGSYGAGSIAHELYGSGSVNSGSSTIRPASSLRRFRATSAPLKANKLHDYFTSVLPSPQKSQSSVFAPVSGVLGSGLAPVIPGGEIPESSLINGFQGTKMIPLSQISGIRNMTFGPQNSSDLNNYGTGDIASSASDDSGTTRVSLMLSNSWANLSGVDVTGLALDIADIRMASAIQQVYEILARGGSRYKSIVASFFGVEVDDPFSDDPVYLGKVSRDLDLYQTAQTSASSETPQGNLAAFGYTSSSGHLFHHRFIEHGYVHIFCVVRHRNIYSSYLPRDNFRLSMLDFYTPPLANISEQPVLTREINPFAPDPNRPFGFQEAWAEYRMEPDRVTGSMRPSADLNLSLWNYADNFDSSLQISNANWLKSNSQDVLDRSLAVKGSQTEPQFKCSIKYHVVKDLPMPTYSVPGMDII